MILKVGDVVQVGPCPPQDMPHWECCCTFCASKSTRIGVVIRTEFDTRVGVALFDFGEWPMHAEDFDPAPVHQGFGGKAKVISTS